MKKIFNNINRFNIKVKIFKRNLFKNFYQSIANTLIAALKKAKTDKEFENVYSMAMNLNSHCILTHNIYLK